METATPRPTPSAPTAEVDAAGAAHADGPSGARWRSAPPPPGLDPAAQDDPEEVVAVGLAVPAEDPEAERPAPAVAILDSDDLGSDDLSSDDLGSDDLPSEPPAADGLDRLSLTDLEVLEADAPPPPPAVPELAVERLSLSDMDELIEPAGPPPAPTRGKPPAAGAARAEVVDLDGLLADAAHVESTRPVVLSTKPEPEPERRRWPMVVAGLAAAAVVAYLWIPKGAPSDARLAEAGESSRVVAHAGAPTPSSGDLDPAEPAPPVAEAQEPTSEPIDPVETTQQPEEPTAVAVAPEPVVVDSAPEHAEREPTASTPRRETRATRPARPPRTERATEQATTEERAPRETARPTPAEPATSPSSAQAAAAPPPPAPRPAVESREDLPDAPTREQVQAAFRAVMPNLRACTGLHGAVPVRVTISGSGRVTVAVVQGHLAGTPEGSCIARAVRTARLPPFRQRRLNVNYPFVL